MSAESMIKWNIAGTSPYSFTQLKLLQILLKQNEIYFVSNECCLFRPEFRHWHCGTCSNRHYAFLLPFSEVITQPPFVFFFFNINTSLQALLTSMVPMISICARHFSLGKKRYSSFFTITAELRTEVVIYISFIPYSRPFSLRYQIHFNNVLSNDIITYVAVSMMCNILPCN